jgi:hypothetical protein
LVVAWIVLLAVLLVAGLVTNSWLWAAGAGLALVVGVLELHRTSPAAVRERAEQEAAALTEWPPERLRSLAAEHDIDPTAAPVALIAAVRRADPRLSLLGAKRLVDGGR